MNHISIKISAVLINIVFLYSILFYPIQPIHAATHPVTLSTTVQEYLSFDVTTGDTIPFGNLTPGTPICSATSSITTITTNAANGYTLGLADGVASPNSSLLHTDTTTRIPKMTNGTIGTPVAWGSNYGVGTGLWAADNNKEAKWGTGTTVCDALNKYAAVPETTTTAHTVTGFHSGADTSSWSWQIDVQNTQKTGAYSGDVTFTATAVLS
jgi:hypothetical protein